MRRARAMLIASMVIFGTIGYFTNFMSISSGEKALYRALMGLVMLGGYLLVTRQKLPLRQMKPMLPLLMLSGVAMGFNWILLFEAYDNTTITVATLSYYFAPVIVMLVCPLIFREKMTTRQVICFVMSTVGLVLITVFSPEKGKNVNPLLGIAFGLGAAVLYATVILLNKFIKGVDGIHRTIIQFGAAVVTLIPYVALTSGVTLNTLDTRGWIFLVILGVVHTGVAYCLYFSSLKELPGQKAAILSYIDPLVAVVVSVTLLHEALDLPWQVVGGALILGFTLWNELPRKT